MSFQKLPVGSPFPSDTPARKLGAEGRQSHPSPARAHLALHGQRDGPPAFFLCCVAPNLQLFSFPKEPRFLPLCLCSYFPSTGGSFLPKISSQNSSSKAQLRRSPFTDLPQDDLSNGTGSPLSAPWGHLLALTGVSTGVSHLHLKAGAPSTRLRSSPRLCSGPIVGRSSENVLSIKHPSPP